MKKFVYILQVQALDSPGGQVITEGVIATSFAEALQKVSAKKPGSHVDILSAQRGPEITIE